MSHAALLLHTWVAGSYVSVLSPHCLNYRSITNYLTITIGL